MKSFAEMIEGYRRFRGGDWRRQHGRWEQLKEGQSPQVMVIACSDSRVDPTQIFDVDPGEIFVVRNVAALVPPFETTPGRHGVSAALEFAVQFLKIRELVVLGHGMCGGCQAALTQGMHGREVGDGGFVARWIDMLDSVREPIAANLGTTGRAAELAMEQAAVKVSLANLRTFPYVSEKEANGTLKLHGAYFAISDGILHILNEADGKFHPTE
ncbi:MAG: carbonate dehydratase [Sphingomonadales bacterium BRH_c3]|nr:MAG: carbonate dehydratase [Sphingomonadales bacterium BRH_c3]